MASAVVGAGAGAAVGGRLSDHWGRRGTLALADGLFCVGALAMAAAQGLRVLILGERLGPGVLLVLDAKPCPNRPGTCPRPPRPSSQNRPQPPLFSSSLSLPPPHPPQVGCWWGWGWASHPSPSRC